LPKVTELEDAKCQGKKVIEEINGRFAEWFGEPPIALFYRLFALSLNILKSCNFGKSLFTSRNYSVIRRLPLFYRRLGFFPQGWYTGTLGSQISHSAIRQVLVAIIRLAFLHFFSFFCSLLLVSILALLLNPNT